MTKPELLALLREAHAETAFDAMGEAVDFVFQADDKRRNLCWSIVQSANLFSEPDALLGVALMMVPEGFQARLEVFPENPEAKLWCVGEDDYRSAIEHPIPAIALTIAALEAMP